MHILSSEHFKSVHGGSANEGCINEDKAWSAAIFVGTALGALTGGVTGFVAASNDLQTSFALKVVGTVIGAMTGWVTGYVTATCFSITFASAKDYLKN